jgi:hypothetical protein
MKRFIYIYFIFLQSFVTFGQDTLNKFNSAGRKTGYWKMFLNKNLISTDSSESYFIVLIPFDNGKPIIKNYKRKWRLDSVACDHPFPQKGNPVFLNGTFQWFDKKNKCVFAKESYKNSYPTYFSYYIPNVLDKSPGHDTIMYLNEFVDFTRRYDNLPGSCYYYYNPVTNTKVKEYSYRKVKRRWKHVQIIEISSEPLEKEIIGTWLRMNDGKKGKTIRFNPNDSAAVYFNDQNIHVDNSSFEVINQNRIILRKGDTYCPLKVYIKNGRLIMKSSAGKEIYVRKT